MKNNEATIKSGIGFHDAPHYAAMGADVSEEFLSGHCVNQELYQDIRNAIHNHFQRESKIWKFITDRRSVAPSLFTQVAVYDAHKVASIRVGLVTPNYHGAGVSIRTAGMIYLSLTEDGLITDIVDKPICMNPDDGRAVHAGKW